VDVMLSTEVRELLGDQALEGVVVEDRQTGARRTLGADALFVFVGVIPCTGWLGDLVALDNNGFVRTGSDAVLARGGSPGSEDGWRHLTLETSEPGIFAVGDVRSGSARRVAAAVGEGAMAIRLAMERTRSALANVTPVSSRYGA
jgi:thioredoxin reductase (NADPH)